MPQDNQNSLHYGLESHILSLVIGFSPSEELSYYYYNEKKTLNKSHTLIIQNRLILYFNEVSYKLDLIY